MNYTKSMVTLSELVSRLTYTFFTLNLTAQTSGPNELSFRNVDAISPLMGYFGLPKGPRAVTLPVLWST